MEGRKADREGATRREAARRAAMANRPLYLMASLEIDNWKEGSGEKW